MQTQSEFIIIVEHLVDANSKIIKATNKSSLKMHKQNIDEA